MQNIYLTEYLGFQPRSSKIVDKLDGLVSRFIPWIQVRSNWRGMASLEFRINLFHLLNKVISQKIEGDIVEIGCCLGESTVIMQKMIKDSNNRKDLYAFDSFEGLPEPDSDDKKIYKKGDMIARMERFYNNFDKLGLKRPITYKGWFEYTLNKFLPEKISFVLIDADLYKSTLAALNAVYSRMSNGAICLLGVYCNPLLNFKGTTRLTYKSPGVKKACDEFLENKPEDIYVLVSGNYTSAYFSKK